MWENRKINDIGNDCLVSVDGTDFQILRKGRKFYSHKFKKSGLRYEVAICIRTGDIVWISGPFPAGRWSDINIFRNGIIHHLDKNERVEADDGYIGESPRYIKCPQGVTANRKKRTEIMQTIVRRRHETVNKRFKDWGILRQIFRHNPTSHGDIFRAIAVITQMAINNGEPLFHVNYNPE